MTELELYGGDGQVMARHLAGHNANVSVVLLGTPDRSEERRVGKECRSRWSPYH